MLLVALASGCGVAPVARQFDRTVTLPPTSFDATWNAVIDLFGDRTWPINTMERDSGIITTDWLLTYDRTYDYMDCGRSTLLQHYADHQVRLNVTVSESKGALSVTVDTAMRAIVRNGYDVAQGTAACASTGLLEREVQDELRQRVND